jgi:Bacterial SH3 domain
VIFRLRSKMIDFSEAEGKFRELQSRVQRGEPLSEEEYQEELAKLMIQDDQGVFWSLEPGTGRWLFFNGTEWVPGTPPRPASAAELPTASEPVTQPGPMAAQGTPAAASVEYPPSEQAQAAEAESVPAYVRTADVREAQGAAGIPPRPVRGTFVSMAEGDRPWLPFAIGAIVLMLCAVALFFGVRGTFLGGAAATATATEVAIEEASPTEVSIPTDTEAPTSTTVPTTPAPSVVTVTTTDNVRVRSGPGTKFGVIATMASGTDLTATGRNSDNSWIQVQMPGKTDLGWMTAEYLTINGDINSLPVVESPTTTAPTKQPAKASPKASETPAG